MKLLWTREKFPQIIHREITLGQTLVGVKLGAFRPDMVALTRPELRDLLKNYSTDPRVKEWVDTRLLQTLTVL